MFDSLQPDIKLLIVTDTMSEFSLAHMVALGLLAFTSATVEQLVDFHDVHTHSLWEGKTLRGKSLQFPGGSRENLTEDNPEPWLWGQRDNLRREDNPPPDFFEWDNPTGENPYYGLDIIE